MLLRCVNMPDQCITVTTDSHPFCAAAALHYRSTPVAKMVQYMHFLEVLERAAPGQGVMSVAEAWRIYLRQRAALWLEGVLVFRTYTVDEDKQLKSKNPARSMPARYKDKDINILRVGSGDSAGASPRTHGLGQAIVRAVTCEQLLWRTHSYGNADLSATYLDFCWPALDWRLLDGFILFNETEYTIGGNSAIPVNDCIKCLSTAATLGRLPTCASNCLQLNRKELNIVSKRCSNVIGLSACNSTVGATQPPRDVRALLPQSLSVLLDTCYIGVVQWQLSHVEILSFWRIQLPVLVVHQPMQVRS
eukprot:TRINITY_DN3055_c0_g1_i3.p1 TRINITY_DN3055_c0_g1~~TRINITY_DN3055_c0_g1_i3.p1  ORF type:complete len:305 (-),score=41.81 TRINITY_DN3055_c0_g1_i3:232-1146(-)